ncbi:restriction endonuclease subunit S [Campylobacter jejuni]|nr:MULTISPECIES: restriction endonuclease subunit S [Campylobacter]EIA56827.1 type II restriction-modification enzyme [Campylobacter coli 2692]AAW35520.1 type II restriction-modification enzyme [Campylobacter jejuni RM1221]ADT72823.1 Type I restriction-modification system, DNA-methyltransferase subunit M / Type I restriction-modification system, specificity subunit S [Campylobacter jejuni subsp. jejuni S3]APT20254.1 restriction endonuclease [Campylobacter coli]ATL96687.1 restriction endonuclea
MITKDNLKQVLENLGFKNKNENYVKTINNYTLLIDYKNQSINYPKEIKIHDKTTSNFSHPENFVVFECVHRLLEKGYKAEHLELEPKWNLGRDKKGGKADILVKDNENNPYLIIECKTTDSKNSEFIKEWNRMQEDGGQLFSYFQQEKGVKYLCLYTSDFSDKLEYKNYIIQAYDNEEYLKEKELQNSYKKSNNNIELFKTWKESYELQYFKQGIFEANVNAYKILEITPTFDNLKELKEEGKYHEFAKILRKHNISGKENAFDKLVNIFLCKIYDETFNKNNLKFGYFGVMADTYANMQDRLMWLYKEAMKEFLGEKITFVSNEDIEKDFKQLKIKTLKEVMQNYIKELKFYSNNDFAFLEVHNKELFLKNALVLKEIVELFANYKLTQNSTNQFLGNLFELFLQKGMKQDEGQFFTPIQICEFIMYSLPLQEMLSKNSKALRVIDYACGAGHFLNTYANELKRYLTEDELKEHYKNIYGIEKEYRLSKVSKVSSAMYGQNEINILYADALASFELANTNNLEGEKAKPQIESNSFDLLIANPPYSVKGFLETLSDKSKNTYKLFNDDINIETNNSIECFFCERANQILNDNAKAAIILPSSILNKDSIYKNTREILFQNFDFIAIVELGNQTFGATGTNTIILFLRKKETFKQENHLISQDYSLIKERIEAENLKDNESFYQNYLSAYCDFRKFDKELYSNFLNGNLDSNLAELEAFKDYRNAFRQTSDYKKLKESKIYKESKDKQDLEDKAFLAYAQAIEKDKLLYFSLSLNQEVLIIKSPSDIKEQKKFLGYEWSNRKGDEGLKELHEPYLSPLFERDNPQNETKLNTLICKAFLKTLSDIPKDLQGYASKARLIDMMDFEKVEFNKAISLNVKSRDELNPFKNSKFELVRLGEVCDLFNGYAFKKTDYVEKSNTLLIRMGNIRPNGEFDAEHKIQYLPDNFNNKYKDYLLNDGDVIIAMTDMGNAMNILGVPTIVKNKNNRNFLLNQRVGKLFNFSEKIIVQYLKYALSSNEVKKQFKLQGYGGLQINLGKTQILSTKIPLPPLEIQKQIVAECEKVEEQYNTLSLSIEEYQKLIKAILQKCGIIEDDQEYKLNSILENLQKLESKLDFNLLFSFIDDFTNARQEDLKKFKEFVKNIKAILGTFSTPPKQGWNKEKLNEIVSIQSGGTPDRKVKEYWNGNINWVKSEVCQNCYVYDYQVKEKITELGLQKSSAKLLKKETTLIALVGATIGKIGFLTFESATNQNITGLYPKNLKILNTKYLYYACMGLYGQFRKLGDFAMANSNFIKNLTISLPPLEIQEKIVQNIELVEQQIDFLNLKLEFLEKEKEKILQKYLFS